MEGLHKCESFLWPE